ncbi:hypothetical protein SH139x_003201 [Planctomycetaceae bacterium SH139]
MNWKTCCWTGLLSIVFVTAASSATAQVGGGTLPLTQTRVVPASPVTQAQPLTPAAAMAMQQAAPGQSPANASAAESADPAAAWEQHRLSKIKQMKFDRRPSTILNLWVKVNQPAPEAASGDAEAAAQNEDASKAVDQPAASASKEAAAEEAVAEEPDAAEPVAEDAAPAEGERTAEESATTESTEEESTTEDVAGDGAAPAAETPAEPAPEEAVPTAEQRAAYDALLIDLSEAVTLGKWEHFREQLLDREQLSEPEALAVYERLLAEMTAQAQLDFEQVVGLTEEMQQFLQSTMANRRNNPAARYAEQNVINFDDLLWIMRSSPVALRDVDISRIARLLQSALSEGNQLADFVDALETLDAELIARQKIALLLSSAGRDDQTARFLPTLEEATDQEDAESLNLLARHFLASHRRDGDAELQTQAWRATLAVLDLKSPTEAQRNEALARAVGQAPLLEDELGNAWLRESFTEEVTRGQEILASIGTATSQRLAQTPQDGDGRTRNLQLQKSAVDALLDSGQELTAEWAGILNILANNWLKEAEVARSYSSSNRFGPSMRRDRYGNLYYVDPADASMEQQQVMRMGQINPVDVAEILTTAPQGKWFEVIDASLQPQFTMALCRLWLKVNEDAKAFPYIEQLAGTHPETARELAEEFLRVWTRNHNPNDTQQRTNSYMFMFGYEQKAESIPLTRSKQERNLEELSEWVTRIRKLPIEKLDENLLVAAFMTCHSVAEVFDIERIEQVFGAWRGIEPATMAGLIQKMRNNLAGIWRDPNVQRDAQTKRRKADIEAEVKRGYQVAKEVIDQALQEHPGQWQLLLAKAATMHDENDFIQEVSPSSAFSERRRQAFAVFQEAAAAYVAVASDLPQEKQKNDAFDYWFYAALGATDLGGLSEKNRPVDSEIDRLAEVLQSLPGEVGQRHRDRFANALFTRMSAVNPACKFRYLEAGFKLVGDNPQAEEARKVYDYYRDLITELELVVRLDGNSSVGNSEPFGIYVDLRHTKELERESGGFGKYLQNQNNMAYAYNYGRPTENYRDKFQDGTTAALQEHFEVLSITFNHPDTTSRAVKPSGWRVTPYAHILLQPRGPQVDKVPSLKLDLDFLDTSGYVALPIISKPLPIDATTESKLQTETEELSLVQVLDERQATSGKLIVETKATGRGLVPALESLVDTEQTEFELSEVEDSGVSVIEFDKEATLPVVLSERTWTLTYVAKDPTGPPAKNFAFPKPVVETKEVRYQRYVDADLEDVAASIALVEAYGTSSRASWIIALCGGAGLVILIGLILAIRSSSAVSGEEEVAEPLEITPFLVLGRLKSAYSDDSLPADQRNQLRDDIDRVERHYFAESNGTAVPNLQEIAQRWKMQAV